MNAFGERFYDPEVVVVVMVVVVVKVECGQLDRNYTDHLPVIANILLVCELQKICR